MPNFETYQQKIAQSLEDVSKLTYNAELRGAQEAFVQIQLRTFATGGQGVKDINGKSLSKYSEPYAKKRVKAGLQIANKDLIFSSDTSVIKDNITVGTSGGGPAMGFLKEDGAKVARYQEEREKTIIFQTNSKEKEIIGNTVKDYIMGELRKMVQKWRE